jgi:hypothetical protein
MPVIVSKVESVRRLFVIGDPTPAGSIPSIAVPGDVVYREDGALTYLVTDGGLVLGTSLDQSPLFSSVTFTTLLSSVTAFATPSALAATALNAFASTVSGGVLMGFGTTHDVALKNRAGTTALGVVANTTTVAAIGSLTTGGDITLATASALIMSGRIVFSPSADGVLTINNGAGTSFGRLNFGGSTSSFPALKRSSADIVVRLGDDTADSRVLASNLVATGAAAAAASGQVGYSGTTRTTIGANGGATALTAAPLGYIDIDVAGVAAQIPYYNRGA